jgi:hypothetical protein
VVSKAKPPPAAFAGGKKFLRPAPRVLLRRHEIYLLVEGEEEVMIGNYQVSGAEGQIDWSAG